MIALFGLGGLVMFVGGEYAIWTSPTITTGGAIALTGFLLMCLSVIVGIVTELR